MGNILTYIELSDGEITDLSFDCLAVGKKIAACQEKELYCLVVGCDFDKERIGQEIFAYADKLFVLDDLNFQSYIARQYSRVVVDAFARANADTVLFPASTLGNDLAASCTVGIEGACVLDAKKLEITADNLIVKRVEFDGKVLSSFGASQQEPLIVTCTDGVSDDEPRLPPRSSGSEVIELTPQEYLNTRETISVIKRELAKKTCDLRAAKIIVAAGAGIGSAEGYRLAEGLANAIGGEVGATRPVVDAGWASADRQIGQTGTTVRPDIYIALGVSGAVQHKVGMSDSKVIIAVNTDSSAPIFKYAHYCIVGDVIEVVPKLIELTKGA